MTTSEKWWTTGAVIIGAIILYLLLHKAGAIAPGWQINIPALAPTNVPSPVEPNINVTFPAANSPSPCQPTCGCSGGDSGLFSSISAMLTKLTGEEAAIEESYFAGIVASLPPWFAQNLNNVEGAYQSGASIQTFMAS